MDNHTRKFQVGDIVRALASDVVKENELYVVTETNRNDLGFWVRLVTPEEYGQFPYKIGVGVYESSLAFERHSGSTCDDGAGEYDDLMAMQEVYEAIR